MEAVVTLNENSPGVKYLCAKDKRLAKAISMVGTISYIPHDDEYAFLIHEIIEQMLSIKAGRQIYERLEALCSCRITPQRVSELSDATIRSLAHPMQKCRTSETLRMLFYQVMFVLMY
ncbi:MAG: hypothetical protein V8R55_10755 [Dysosmobacter sp.]